MPLYLLLPSTGSPWGPFIVLHTAGGTVTCQLPSFLLMLLSKLHVHDDGGMCDIENHYQHQVTKHLFFKKLSKGFKRKWAKSNSSLYTCPIRSWGLKELETSTGSIILELPLALPGQQISRPQLRALLCWSLQQRDFPPLSFIISLSPTH